uniref:N-alpha-acetyltransferase 25, NatB auxiliary subunit n=1 Tax=Callorhinchus milii TaxID=7868 RepID=A0A4W3J8N9_CALMI
MAARSHVQDPNDRRLRPIYDYLDNGNNKMAIQQADKLLKKHRDLHCAKVLKAIGLQRTGKQDEAFSLAQEVAALEPTDDNSLQALTILYREMHRPELVTKLYEAAVRKVPSSEEYHSHLFMAYARVGEYKKMQQAGMALYKIVPKNPYYFWSVMSLVMQSISEQDEKLSKTMFLPLAQRMVEKMVKEDKIEAEAEVQLYLMILERLRKDQEALEVIRGKLGEKLTSELQSREMKCMVLYKKLVKWPECNSLSRKLLLKNPDDWQFYLSFFDSLFHLIDEGWTPPAEGEHSLEGPVTWDIQEAIAFVEERVLNEEPKGSRCLRGPYLAKLELIRRLKQRGTNDEHKLGIPEDLMFHYFERFGDRPCCYSDLRIFADLLSPERHTQFINKLLEVVPLSVPEEGSLALPADIKAMQRHMFVIQFSRLLGLQQNMDQAQRLALVQELLHRYKHGLDFGKSCLKTELQFSDNYCLLAVHVLLDIWNESGEEWPLWRSLALLEETLSHSPSSAQFKLLLIRIYCLLGTFEPVVDLYTSLDAKHVQHDTIGYLLTRYSEPLGHLAAASQACNFTLRFFHSNQKDTSEYIIQAYKYGAFEKIPEFIAFRNRLNNSLHFAQVRIERMLLDLFFEANTTNGLEESIKSMGLCPEDDDIPWDELRDNRDLTVHFSWDPSEREMSEEERQISMKEEMTWLRIRSLTLRLVGTLATGSHGAETKNSKKTAENGVASRTDTLQLLIQQLEGAIQTGKKSVGQPIQVRYLSHRLGWQLQRGWDSYPASSCFENNSPENNSTKWVGKSLRKVIFNKCKGNLLETKETECKSRPELLEYLVFLVETVCIILWVSYYCGNILRPLKSSIQKKKKKKKDINVTMPTVFSSFQDYVARLQTFLSDILEHLKGLEETLAALKFNELTLEASGIETFLRIVRGKIQSSYQRSLQETSDLLRKRLDTVKSLKI